ERPEALREGDLLVLLEELAREDQQGVFQPGGVQGLPGRLVDLGQAEVGDHRPERGVDRLDVEGFGHGVLDGLLDQGASIWSVSCCSLSCGSRDRQSGRTPKCAAARCSEEWDSQGLLPPSPPPRICCRRAASPRPRRRPSTSSSAGWPATTISARWWPKSSATSRRRSSTSRSSRADRTSTAWRSSPRAATRSARSRRARR